MKRLQKKKEKYGKEILRNHDRLKRMKTGQRLKKTVGKDHTKIFINNNRKKLVNDLLSKKKKRKNFKNEKTIRCAKRI